MNTLLVLSLQVTLVALVGMAVSLTTRKWMSTSGTLPLGATLGAVVLLTACAFSPWPSWLHRPETPKAGSGLLNVTLPEIATDPVTAPFVEHLTPTPWGSYVSLPRWADSILYGIPNEDDALGQSVETNASVGWTWQHWLLLMVGGAMLIGLIRVIGGLWAVRLFVRTSRPLKARALLEEVDLLRAEMGCTLPVGVRECPQMATAATVSWRKPVVLLSDSWQSWTPEQLRSVLAHEIAHITRGDFLATVAAQVGVVLHFYHPLVHWLANRLRLEQELAADALAAKVVGGSRAYLNAIGELALKQSSEPVGWPAHSFLPTRRTFLRRIEMLRDLKLLSGGTSRLAKWATLASVAAVTLVAIGLRPPVGDSPTGVAEAQEKLPESTPTTRTPAASSTMSATAPLEAKYVPADAFAVFVARPVTLNEQFQKLQAAKLIPENAMNPLNDIANCESASGFLALPPTSESRPYRNLGLCMTFSNRDARDVMLQKMAPPQVVNSGLTWQKRRFLLFEFEELAGPGVDTVPGECRHIVDDQTILFAGSPEVLKKMFVNGPKSNSPMTQTESWKAATQGTVAVAIDAAGIQKVMAQAPPNPIIGLFSPLWTSASSHTLSLKFADKAQMSLTSLAKDATSSQQLEGTLKSGVAMLTGMLDQAKSSPDPATKATAEGLLPIFAGHKLMTTGNLTSLTCEADLSAVAALLAPPISQARAAAQRTQQMNNMKQVMLALHNYHEVYGHLPPAIVIDKNSGVPRSWRVEILPFIEGASLYDQYKKDQPWDSEENKKILGQMPFVFRHPSHPAGATNTSIFAAYGDGFAFQKDDKIGLKFHDIADGTSATIAIIEAQGEIPWTKPEEPLIDLSQGAPKNFGFDPTAFAVGLCDGSVQMIARTIDPQLLKVMFTRNGGEVLQGFDRPLPGVPAPAPGAPATPR